MSGKLPKEDNEIAIDRLYAENNNLEIGDNLKIQNKTTNSRFSCTFRLYSIV